MRNVVRIAAVLGMTVFSATVSFAATQNVYLLAGQSNATGLDASAYKKQSIDLVIQLYPELATSAGLQLDLTENEIPPGDDPSAPRWAQKVVRTPYPLSPIMFNGFRHSGSEIVLGRSLYNGYSRQVPFVVAKFTVDGSGLDLLWMNSDSVDISDRLIMYLYSLKTTLAARGDSMVLSGLFWIQGEADTDSMAHADNYLTNFTNLVKKVRTFAKNPILPVVLARTNLDLSKRSIQEQQQRTKPLATVRAAQVSYANSDPCAALMNLDDLTHNSGGTHYEPSQYNIMGDREYRLFVSITQRAACQPH